MKTNSRCLALTACMMALFGLRASEHTDFVSGVGTNGWTIADHKYVSPRYSNAVDQISLAYSSENTADSISLYAFDGESPIATFTAAASAASLSFPDTSDFRMFRLVTSGSLTLQSFDAEVSSAMLAAPSAVTVSNNITGTSFDALWAAVEGAVGYRVSVWTNVLVDVSDGTDLWFEGFPDSPATGSNTKGFEDNFAQNSGWEGLNVFATASAGVVRIGSSSQKGWLMTPSLTSFAASSLTLRFKAWRYSKDSGVDMPIRMISGSITNDLAVISLTTNSTLYHVSLPPLATGDRIVFHSTTNKSDDGRVSLDDVAIVEGYSEGQEAPDYIVRDRDVGNMNSCFLEGLPSVPVQFAVAAYGRRGLVSGLSASQTVDLSHPQPVERLLALSISTLVGNVYTQSFDSLAAITATAGPKDWLNGTTLPCWQAWQGATAASQIRQNGGTITQGGFYALSSNITDGVRALGARANVNVAMSWGIAFSNDTETAVNLAGISFSAQQWGFANTNEQALSLSCLVTDRLAWMPDLVGEWVAGAESWAHVYGDDHAIPECETVNFTPATRLRLDPGDVLVLKWTLQPFTKGNSSIMAIDDLVVTFESKAHPLTVHIVQKANMR